MIESKNDAERARYDAAMNLIELLAKEREAQLAFRAMALGFQKATPAEVAAAKRSYIEANAKVSALLPRAKDALMSYFAMIEEQRRATHLS